MSLIEANKSNFEENIKSGLVLVDFNADWCGPCQIFAPVLEELSKEIPEKILSVNIDDSPEIAEKYSVSGIPCLVIFQDGEEIDRSVGALPKKKVQKLLEKHKR